MALARELVAATDKTKQIRLTWKAPLDFNNSVDELILTKSISHFPMELYNASFPTKATDSRPVEIYRGKSIVGLDSGSISVSGSTLQDTAATFPTSPSLAGRLLRDAQSSVYKILSNTATTITVDGTPANGIYIVLPDFNPDVRLQENYELDSRTTVDVGLIRNLVIIDNNALMVKNFAQDEVANLIFVDGAGTKFLIKSNTPNTLLFFDDVSTPVIGPAMKILNSHTDTQPLPYIDNFYTDVEAAARAGTGLEADRFYYYTLFTKPEGANVAQAEFGIVDSGTPTQKYAISPDDTKFGERLYSLWPGVFRNLDSTGDLEDVMQVFGAFFDELHAIIDTYKLQDSDYLLTTALLPLSEQTGLPSIGFAIGADTLRRIAKDLLSCWKLKGSKEGIAHFIRMLTTWDITDGTADFANAIEDGIPNIFALRFFDSNLGTANLRITQSEPSFTPGGRFVKGLPGIIIPGFFSFREFVIKLPDVALFVGTSESYSVEENTTKMLDSTANYGPDDSLVGNFLLPNQEEINDIFQIISNTATTITVRGIVINKNPGGSYAILSPLNTNRFIILNKMLQYYIPFGTLPGFQFT